VGGASEPQRLDWTVMSTRPLQVAFAIPALDHGGPDRVLFELLCGLDRARFSPSLLVSEPDGYYLERLPKDIPVEVLRSSRATRRYPVFDALRFVRRARPDVVFATLRMSLTLGIVAPAYPRHTRLIVRQANDLSADFAALIKQSLIKHRVALQLSRAVLRTADAVVCQSEAMKRDLRSLVGGRARLYVIGNPIDVDKVAQATSHEHVTLSGSPALVSVGRLAPQKGYDVLLPALREVQKRYPRVHLTIVGDGPDRAALASLASTFGLTDAVSFVGFQAEPLPYVRAADLFVLASRYEGFPNAALEAMACGTPVVLTDCPGANAEILEPGINGRLAARIDAEAVAGSIMDALDELPRYDRERIRAICDQRFASHRIVQRYEHVISAVAQS
jgi:glycosyltransferase involved in cell wall biosynthesis